MKPIKLWLATMATLLFSLTASAYDFEVDGIYYNLVSASELTVEVTKADIYNYYSGDISIPSTINYSGKTMTVSGIGEGAFLFCDKLTNVNIPNSVISIGESAFGCCSGLTSITIPYSVTNITRHAFFDCDGLTKIIVDSNNTIYDSRDNCNAIIETKSNTLIVGSKNTTIPSSVTSIGIYAFDRCSGLTAIIIPNSVTNIDYEAFSGCDGLTNITIPNSVINIEYGAFRDCSKLADITISNSVTSIGGTAFEGTAWYNNQPDGLIYKDGWLIGYKGSSRPIFDIVIPNGTRCIAGWAFADCSGITGVKIPNSVTNIGTYAFKNCTGLTSFAIPNSVTSIGESAFSGCNAIEKLELNCPKIDSWLFWGMPSLKEVIIGDDVKEIKESAFSSCDGLTSVIIGNGITSIENSAFSGCDAIEKLELNCPEIDSWFCQIQSLKEVAFGNSVTNIGNGAFYGCNRLTSVEIPNSVTSIGESAFYGCSGFTSVVIPNSVTSIGNYAFYGCSGLTSVVIPNSVANIGNGAFYGCNRLTSVELPNRVTNIGEETFRNCSGLTNINIPNSVTSIGMYAFSGCFGLTSVIIGDGVTSIGNFAFNSCSGLTNITIGNSVTTIENGAFYGCKAIEKLELNCPEIDSWFRDSQSIKEVTLGNSVISIGEHAFYDCSGITDITIPNSVTSVGRWAFENTAWYDNQPDGIVYAGKVLYDYKGTMPYNTDITIEEGTLGITSAAFQNCFGLTCITIPNSVTSIGSYAFDGCTSLTAITIPESVTNIGERAFEGCYALKKINSFIPAEKLFVPDDYAFERVDKETCTLYVPEGDVSAYQSTAGWNEFEHIIDFDPYFTITYLVDGEVYSTETIEYGSEIILIDEPVREGHTFSGWSEAPESMPANNITVYGTFTANKYLVTFKIGDEVIFSAPIEYGASIVAPEAPEKEGYSFDGWSEMPETVPAHDVIVYGTFTKLFVETIVINDSDFSFSMEENTECGEITYTRNFRNTNWQALYVPFEIPVTEELLADFEVADLNDVRQYDRNDDGVKDETVIEAFKVKSGVLEANYPYLIRAREAGEKTITVTDATLFAAEENSIDCSSVREKFTFTGTYSRLSSNELPQGLGYYALSGGVWQPVAANASLGAFRFYLKVESRDGLNSTNKAIRMRIIGEDGTSEISELDLSDNSQQAAVVYDLQGRRINETSNLKGLYIVNGKKVMF